MDDGGKDANNLYELRSPLRIAEDDQPLEFPNDYGLVATVGRPGMSDAPEGLFLALKMFIDSGQEVAVNDYITAPNGKDYRFTGTSFVYVEEHVILFPHNMQLDMQLLERQGIPKPLDATVESIANLADAWRKRNGNNAPEGTNPTERWLGWSDKVKASQVPRQDGDQVETRLPKPNTQPRVQPKQNPSPDSDNVR